MAQKLESHRLQHQRKSRRMATEIICKSTIPHQISTSTILYQCSNMESAHWLGVEVLAKMKFITALLIA